MAGMSQVSESETLSQANQAKNDAAVYEIGFLLVPTIDEDAALAAFSRLRKTLDELSASVLAEESPKKISLAYRIERSSEGKREKYSDGYFSFVKFELPEEGAGAAVQMFETKLRADRHVLRCLLIKTSREAPVAPRSIFASKSLEGRVIERPVAALEERGPVDEGELNKSIDALVEEDTTK
ncbi:MAG: 30S ribosomal protein S6 [Minisyncoccia bacterium]